MDIFLSIARPWPCNADNKTSLMVFILITISLSLIDFITKLIAKRYRFFSIIGRPTYLVVPPNFLGNNIKSGVIFNKETNKTQKGSILSLFLSSNFKFTKKLKAQIFRPRKIKDLKNK
jgi:hypothetical protein